MKTKDERHESKALRELRKENIRLKRQIKEMRKEVRQIEDEDTDDSQPLVQSQLKSSKHKFTCPSCGSYSAETFEVIGRHFFRCEDCGSKGRLE